MTTEQTPSIVETPRDPAERCGNLPFPSSIMQSDAECRMHEDQYIFWVYSTGYNNIRSNIRMLMIYFPNFLTDVTLFEPAVCDYRHCSLNLNDKSMLTI